MHRQVGRVIDQQASWAKPLGEGAQRAPQGGVRRDAAAQGHPQRDIVGHPVHPVVTDVPVGAMTVAAVLDVTGQDTAADLAVLTGLASMAASAATGAADAVERTASGRSTRPCTRRSWSRRSPPMGARCCSGSGRAACGRWRGSCRSRATGRWPPVRTWVATSCSGTETRSTATRSTRNRRSGRRWTCARCPQARSSRRRPDRTRWCSTVRRTAIRSALSSVCAHEGGPLDKGEIVDGCVECPWHGSRFNLADGHVGRAGRLDLPVFEVRETADGGLEARRAAYED